jgi:hypothetical protein
MKGVMQSEGAKKLSAQEKEKRQPKPIKGGKADFKFWEFCQFCWLRMNACIA